MNLIPDFVHVLLVLSETFLKLPLMSHEEAKTNVSKIIAIDPF